MSNADAFDRTGKIAVQQNIQGTLDFLKKSPPFNLMDVAHLTFMVENCKLRFYAAGESIIKPEDGPVEYFFIVKQGLVTGKRSTAQTGNGENTFEISSGECFPLAALLGERATRTEHLAAQDTFCLLLPKAAFVRLFSTCNLFRDFCLRGVSSLLDQVNQQVQMRAAESLGSQYSLETTLGELAMREPLTCPPEETLQGAVRLMHQIQVGSIVIADADMHALGIFTLRDLRKAIAKDGADLQQPISQLMTPDPFHLSPRASAFDAAIAMTERHIAHVCLVDKGRLCGVVSERDLFSLQRVDLVHLARSIRHAGTVETLVLMRDDIHHLVDNMLAHGASSTQITHLITLLNDHMVCRVIELCIEEHGDPGVEFSWLVFGSEGRREQTLHTDQDNGILFQSADQTEAERIRQLLLPLAGKINAALDQCGFTLCKGNIMASNPELCLSQQEWSQRLSGFVRSATPENLLGSTIYFDLRVIWGPEQGCQQLRQQLLEQIAENSLFQKMMAANALNHRPPLGGLFRDFSLARKGADKHTLDLKVQGLTPFVDAARLLALANGVEDCSTLERLDQLVMRGVIEALDGAAYEEAYRYIQLIRMQLHQAQAKAGLPYSNRIDPDELNDLDRRVLRESFRQAQRLQSSLSLRYQL
jgi:CBS domain-containing protein